jgi:D-alanine-D-alanine ligase
VIPVAIVYNRPDPARADSEDVLTEAAFVEEALRVRGHPVHRVICDNGLGGVAVMADRLRVVSEGGVVFNLIESLGNDPRLYPAAAALFDIAGLRYTGSSYEALVLTTDKAFSKSVLFSRGIATPEWAVYPDTDAEACWHTVAAGEACIAKPLWEDASVGVTDESVFSESHLLMEGLIRMYQAHGDLLVEKFLDGAEYNISVLEDRRGEPMVLPIAEMSFDLWPEGKPRIVNYRAKWNPGSFEYQNTRRVFLDAPELASDLSRLAVSVWKTFRLSGYARVDIRTDKDGKPHVIEINANPCISPDSGFVAAATKEGLSPEELVGAIVEAATRG